MTLRIWGVNNFICSKFISNHVELLASIFIWPALAGTPVAGWTSYRPATLSLCHWCNTLLVFMHVVTNMPLEEKKHVSQSEHLYLFSSHYILCVPLLWDHFVLHTALVGLEGSQCSHIGHPVRLRERRTAKSVNIFWCRRFDIYLYMLYIQYIWYIYTFEHL